MSVAANAFEVRLVGSDERFMCTTGESVLRGMLRLGRRGIPVGCLGGGCGVCKVRIVEGRVMRLGPVSRAHVSADEEAAGSTLACKVTPATALLIEPMGCMASRFAHGALATPVRVNQSINGDK
jgi:3-phenylpropionate/trans-cinnamate dioxygenase ferredoxin reductase subunit